MSILIKNVQLDSNPTDILISWNTISQIAKNIDTKADITIDGTNKAVIPGLMNGHTHAAMSLFKGFADDMPLFDWLEQKIWPLEQKLTEEDVYWGTKLACLEMIKSGTTFFNDMYWHFLWTAKAVKEMGMRATLGPAYVDFFDESQAQKQIEINKQLFAQSKDFPDRIQFILSPHAIYTVSENSLKWIKSFADKNNLQIHMHISETEKEVKDCVKKHGKRPFEYLEQINFLGPNLVTCHAVWLNDNEINLCKKYNVKVVYNPVSNLKLASGHHFPYQKMIQNWIKPVIGTDGSASNNNLDILESLKFASLIQKSYQNDPTTLPVEEAFKMATTNWAHAFWLNTGEIKQGMLADLLLIDLDRPEMTPNHNLYANLIYSANASCVNTTICDGKILMQNRKVKDEDIILENAREIAYDLVGR